MIEEPLYYKEQRNLLWSVSSKLSEMKHNNKKVDLIILNYYAYSLLCTVPYYKKENSNETLFDIPVITKKEPTNYSRFWVSEEGEVYNYE